MKIINQPTWIKVVACIIMGFLAALSISAVMHIRVRLLGGSFPIWVSYLINMGLVMFFIRHYGEKYDA